MELNRYSCHASYSGQHQSPQFVSLKHFSSRNSSCRTSAVRQHVHAGGNSASPTLENFASIEDALRGAVRRQQATEHVEKHRAVALAEEDIISRKDLFSGCEPHVQTPLRVAVLLSGGVDSSLTLHLLKEAGHSVTAFYLQVWFQEDFENFWSSCPWEEDLAVCKEVCMKEGVPLQVVPLTDQYWQRVVSHSISEIRSGRTPNPDILCNSRVKFGAFYEFLEANHAADFDRVASGHYAQVIRGGTPAEPVQLALTPDAVKDQTYFLAHLSQAQLARVMFPLGNLTKVQVRQLAAAAGLPNQSRRDSQGICFLGKVRYDEFVRQHLGTWPGPLVDEESGEVVGFHNGFWFYTPGQRKGIFLSGGPWYVSRKDCKRNVVFISRQYFMPERRRDAFRCGMFNWISGSPPWQHGQPQRLKCKVRHGPQLYDCLVHYDEVNDCATVALDGNDQGLAPGQYAVFYQDGVCHGAAVILEALQDAQELCELLTLETGTEMDV